MKPNEKFNVNEPDMVCVSLPVPLITHGIFLFHTTQVHAQLAYRIIIGGQAQHTLIYGSVCV